MKTRTAAAYLPQILFALGCLMAVMDVRAQTPVSDDDASLRVTEQPVLMASAPISREQPVLAVQPVQMAAPADPARIERAENRKMISAWLGIPETELNSIMRLVRLSPEERRAAAPAPAQEVAERP